MQPFNTCIFMHYFAKLDFKTVKYLYLYLNTMFYYIILSIIFRLAAAKVFFIRYFLRNPNEYYNITIVPAFEFLRTNSYQLKPF